MPTQQSAPISSQIPPSSALSKKPFSSDLLTPPRLQNQLTVRQSLEWLRRYNSCGLSQSIEFLRLASESSRMLTLYEEMFPREWGASTKGVFTPSKESALYTEREAEFFTLLDRHVAPLNTDWLYENDEGRMPFVPIHPLQEYDWYYDEGPFEELPLAYQLALALNRTDSEVFDNFCELHNVAPEVLPAGKVNWERLSRVMCAGNTPLKYLPQTIDMTAYSTGNPLLDWHPEAGEAEVGWTLEELQWLGSLRRQGELLQQRAARLSRWLKEPDTLEDRLNLCVRLWNLAGTEHDQLLATKEAVGRACAFEVRRFRSRINPHADQLTLFDSNPSRIRRARLCRRATHLPTP